MPAFVERIRRTKLFQWTLAYLAGAWLAVQLLGLLSDQLGWPSAVFRVSLALLAVGFLATLVVAWYHGEQGRQRVSGPELLILATLFLIGSGVVAVLTGRRPASASGAEARTANGAAEASMRSIAVLPFRNLSGDAESEPFVNGIHEDVLTRLSKIGDLKVISSTSVARFKDTQEGLPRIAQQLGVVWILEGGVQRAGGRVRVNAQLIRGVDDQHAWAETYDRELTLENIFDIQAEVARKIADALAAEITPEEERRMAAGTTGSLSAYDLYSRGRFELIGRSEDGIRRAVDLFGLAIAQDSTYALAYSGLADALGQGWFYGYDVGDRPQERSLEAARRAVALAPELAEGHATLGSALGYLRDAPGAEAEFRRALELNPRYATAHGWYSILLQNQARVAESLEHGRSAVELDPLAPAIQGQAASAFWISGERSSAIEHQRRSVELGPGRVSGRVGYGWMLVQAGEYAAGIREMEAARRDLTEAGRRIWGPTALLAEAHALAGQADSARVLLAEAERRGEEPFYIALGYAALNDWDRALKPLAISRFERVIPRYLRYDPVLDPLRADPRFQKIVTNMERAWGMR